MAEIRQALAQCFKELMQEKSFQKIIVKMVLLFHFLKPNVIICVIDGQKDSLAPSFS